MHALLSLVVISLRQLYFQQVYCRVSYFKMPELEQRMKCYGIEIITAGIKQIFG